MTNQSNHYYTAQCARDAQSLGYGDKSYWDVLETSSLEIYAYYLERGMTDMAERMLTRSLSEALQGNDGE